MRLGQLARKLALRPAEIVAFLNQNNILTEESTNTKLDNEHVRLVLKQFAPSDLEAEEFIKNEENSAEEVLSPSPLSTSDTNADTQVETVENSKPESEPVAIPSIEVIKAPKVELSGLKVLGKIELREPRKKETKESEEQPSERKQESEPPHKTSRKPYQNRNNTESRPRKNPIALQREREARDAQLQKEAEAKLQKERRTEYYQRKVKSVPTKSAKLVNEPLEQVSSSTLVEPPKTLLGRFLRWLTT